MTWNYRIIRAKYKRGDEEAEFFCLHEVYYDKEGVPWTRCEEPAHFGGETQEEVMDDLEMALADARRHPVLNDEDIDTQAWNRWLQEVVKEPSVPWDAIKDELDTEPDAHKLV